SSTKLNKKIKTVSTEFYEALKHHQWKGNIRELKNVIERSLILVENEGELKVENLPMEMQHFLTSYSQPTPRLMSAFELASAEKLHIQKVLNYTNGNKTKTAELLGIALTTLYRKMNEYNLE
ncbi:MAG: helix-turn-helix domain-containing protein, partial [Runella sp.]